MLMCISSTSLAYAQSIPDLEPRAHFAMSDTDYNPARIYDTEQADILTDTLSKIDSLQKENDSLKNVLSSSEDLIIKTISKVALTKASKENIGILSIKKDKAIQYDRNEISYRKDLVITRIDMSILDGTIYAIQVVTDDNNVYSNKRSQISLTSFDRRHKDKLYPEGRGNNNYIKIGDFLRYQTAYGRLFLPDDTTVTLTPGKNYTATLVLDPSLSSLIEARVYSDVMGLSGKANGIIQTELYTKFIGNTINLRNTRYVFLNYISPYFSFSKFDSKFDTVALYPDTSISRMQLLQLSPVQYGVTFNLISYFRMHRFEINTGVQGNLTRNLLFPDSTVSDINQYSWFGQIGGTFTRGRNYGLDMSLKFIYNWLADEPKLNPEKTSMSIWILNPEANLFWFPGNDKNNKIFFRYRGFYNMSHSDTNFIQLQLGYSFNINKLFKQQ
jgi:hypothetical protein